MGLFDEYNRRARILPAALVISPLLIFLPQVGADIMSLFHVFTGTGIIATAGLAMASAIVRQLGVSYEKEFNKRLGGWPSTVIVRWRDDTKSDEYKRLIHEAVQRKFGMKLFSRDEEELDPEEADKRIEDAFGRIKKNIRGDKARMSHQDNIDYGFVRNLFGARWVWIGSCAFSTLCCALIPYLKHQEINWILTTISAVFLACVVLIEWGVVKSHIEHCAFAYARSAWDDIWSLPDKEGE